MYINIFKLALVLGIHIACVVATTTSAYALKFGNLSVLDNADEMTWTTGDTSFDFTFQVSSNTHIGQFESPWHRENSSGEKTFIGRLPIITGGIHDHMLLNCMVRQQ